MDYGVDAVSEMMKIKYFQDGIPDPFFNLVCLSIQTTTHLFTTFDQVQEHYTIFKQTTAAQDNPGTTRRGISSLGRGGPGGGAAVDVVVDAAVAVTMKPASPPKTKLMPVLISKPKNTRARSTVPSPQPRKPNIGNL
jgi:hypothetical protein